MDVLMPQLGETVTEGKITKWFKQAGDAVKPGDNLFEIETDKTSMEVPSTTAGTLTDINFQVGQVAKVGAVVAVIGGAGESAKSKTPAVPHTPLTPAKAGVQSQELDARLRGHERSLASGATTQRHWGCMAGTVIYRGDVDLTEPTEAWDADQDEAPRSAKATEP
jgi:pyruvate dehydrogenase E2 component (dihydrolipoamide acetyltransferase)